MDDEADAFELRRVLDEAKGDAELREQWQRFHVIRDVMRGPPRAYAPELRDAIWRELRADEGAAADASLDVIEISGADEAPDAGRATRWGPLAGGAIAATVALLIVLGAGLFEEEPGVEIARDLYVPSGGVRAASEQITAADRQRRNAYYLSHAQFRGMNQVGVASFTKVVTFDEARMDAGEGRQAASAAPNPAE